MKCNLTLAITNQNLCLCFLMIKRRSVLSCLSGKVETRRISQTEDALPPPAFVSTNKPACIVAMKQHNLLSRRSEGNGRDRDRHHPTTLILQELPISRWIFTKPQIDVYNLRKTVHGTGTRAISGSCFQHFLPPHHLWFDVFPVLLHNYISPSPPSSSAELDRSSAARSTRAVRKCADTPKFVCL